MRSFSLVSVRLRLHWTTIEKHKDEHDEEWRRELARDFLPHGHGRRQRAFDDMHGKRTPEVDRTTGERSEHCDGSTVRDAMRRETPRCRAALEVQRINPNCVDEHLAKRLEQKHTKLFQSGSIRKRNRACEIAIEWWFGEHAKRDDSDEEPRTGLKDGDKQVRHPDSRVERAIAFDTRTVGKPCGEQRVEGQIARCVLAKDEIDNEHEHRVEPAILEEVDRRAGRAENGARVDGQQSEEQDRCDAAEDALSCREPLDRAWVTRSALGLDQWRSFG